MLVELLSLMSELLDAQPMESLFTTYDMKETPNELVVYIDMPGLNASDIDIDIKQDKYLYVKGVRKEDKSDESDDFIVKRRIMGSFQYLIPLPTSNLEFENMEATYSKGVLEIRIPKKQKKKVKVVVKSE